ncbi:MAG: lipoyl synthase [Candidatus Bruticola sp.]
MAEEELTIPEYGSEGWKNNPPKPEWLKVRMYTNNSYGHVSTTLKKQTLHTVCQEARCPNISECWSCGTATFMILGSICTRGCAYCAVNKGKPLPLEEHEAERLAEAAAQLNIKYLVITSVTRDDLSDGGAACFAEVIRAVRVASPETKVEVLIPDFGGNLSSLQTVLQAEPQVLNHNVETVARLYPRVRSRGNYERCLSILKYAREHLPATCLTKSGLMVGLGESHREVLQVMDDLRSVGTDILTIGQYLRPSLRNVPVLRYRTPEEFNFYRQEGLKRGFKYVESSPLARSSYHARSHSEPLLSAKG